MVTTVPATLSSFLAPFARHFRARGWKVDAMARDVSSCDMCRDAFDQVWNAPWSRNPLSLRNLFAPVQVREAATEEAYDLVHVHTPVAAFTTRYALRRRHHHDGPTVIYTAHGFHFYRGAGPVNNALFPLLEKMAGRWTDLLIVINGEDYRAAQSYQLVPPERLIRMPGIGVDTCRYSPRAVSQNDIDRVRTELSLASQDRMLLMVAEFNAGKRHKDALYAFANLNRSETHLAFAGEGRLVGKSKKLAAQLGVLEQVRFLGFRDDIPALMRASVATILPSEREGLSRSVMESLCLEVPVIGADIRGIRDIVDDGTGLLVKVGNIEGLTKAMAWVLDNPAAAQERGQRGRCRMADHDLQRVIELHEELYTRALQQKDPSCFASDP
jgi:glycosyltransferase involved in cell wall biosynthesis